MDTEIDIKRYLRIFLRRKWIIIGLTGGLLLITILYTRFTTKTFIASTKVLIKRSPMFIEGSDLVEEAFSMETNCEILRSRDLTEKVVEKMRQDKIDIDFLGSQDAPDILLLEIMEIKPVRNTNIVEISACFTTADGSALLANYIAETFKDYSITVARRKITEVRKFLENQLPYANKRLQESEKAIQEFKEKTKLISVSTGGSVLQERLSELEEEYSSTLTEIAIKNKALSYLESEIQEESRKLVKELVRTDNPSIAILREQLINLERTFALYEIAGLEKEHPKATGLKGKIENIKNSIKQKIESRETDDILIMDPLTYSKEISRKILDVKFDILSLKAKKEAISATIKQYNQEIRRFPEKEYQLARLQRKYQFDETIYKRIIDKYEESKISEVGQIGNVVIIEKALAPAIPISPKPKQNIIFGLIFGLGLGITGALLWEFLDTSIKDMDDVAKLKIPIAGVIPFVGKDSLIVHSSPNSVGAEAYKKLRVNLKFSQPGTVALKTFLITSCLPEEGKTSITSNLAITYALCGFKTLIIGADIRKPRIYKIFDIPSQPGLTDVLVHDKSIDQAIIKTDIENLFILPAGYIPPNPGELLDSGDMKKLIQNLKGNFDYLIIDSPPIVTCADALVLANITDATILTLELKKSNRDIVIEIANSIRHTNTALVGLVLNKVTSGSYYGYRYYKYYGGAPRNPAG